MKKMYIISPFYRKILVFILFWFIILVTFSLDKILDKNLSGVGEHASINVNNLDLIEQKFLCSNYTNLSLDKEYSQFKLLETELERNEVFFTGEAHGADINPKLDFELLRFLKTNAGIKYYLLERSYAFGEVINQYLESGEEDILFKLYENYDQPFALNEEVLEYWREVYKYNRSLPDDQKIKFIGIDIEFDIISALWYLTSLMPYKTLPNEFELEILHLGEIYENVVNSEKISQRNLENIRLIDEYIVRLAKDMKENESIYIKYLEDDFFSFNFTVNNIIKTFNFLQLNGRVWKGPQFIRDEIVYDNFLTLYDRLPKGKYFGQWGARHIFQKRVEHGDRIATLLNQDGSPVKGKVLSILYLYKDSYILNPNEKGVITKSDYFSEKKIFDPFLNTQLTLFKLIGENSPFNNHLVWEMNINSLNPTGGVTTDYFQYLVIIKDAKAMVPIK